MIRRLWAVGTVALLLACGGESGPNGIDVGSIEVTPDPVLLAQQESVELRVAAFDEAGALLTGVPVTFTVGNAKLVTVSSAGVVQSVGPAGTTSVTVKAGTASTTVPVSIEATGNSISVLPAQASLPQMGTLQLQPTLFDRVGTEVAGAQFTYASSNPQVAVVNETGLVTSVGPTGQVSITVGSDGLTAQVAISVEATPASISVTPNPIQLGQASKLALRVQVLDAVGLPIADPELSYSAEPVSLLTVSEDGVLSAQGTPGSGSVTVSAGTVSIAVPVTVVDVGTLTGTILGTVGSTGQPYGVAIGAGDTYYGVGLTGQLDIGSFTSASVTSYPISSAMTIGIAVHPTNGLIYVAGNLGDGLMEIDPGSGTVLRRWAATGQMFDVAISPDGTQLYVAGEPDRVYVISTATMTLLRDYPTGGSVIHLLAHPSQPLVYTSGAGNVREINIETGATRSFTLPDAQATALAVTGDKLFIGGESQELGVVDLATGATTTFDVACRIYDLVAAPDGEKLLATCSQEGKAVLLDAETYAVVADIATGGFPRRAAIKQDGTGAVIASESGSYYLVQ